LVGAANESDGVSKGVGASLPPPQATKTLTIKIDEKFAVDLKNLFFM